MIPVAMAKGGADGMREVFVRFWTWNAMEWGSVGFVYVGAGMRVSFLARTSGWWTARASVASSSALKED